MKKRIIYLSIISILISSQIACTSISKEFEVTGRNYEIIMFSGGDIIFKDKFKGIVNKSTISNGIYYYKDGKLIEISGDYIIRSY